MFSFATVQTERTWTELLIKRLQLVAQIFANAHAQRQAEQVLRDRETRLSLAADAAGVGLWGPDVATNRYWLTDKARETFGFNATEIVTPDRVISIIHPDNLPRVQEASRSLFDEGRNVFASEYCYLHPTRGTRWFRHVFRVMKHDASGHVLSTTYWLERAGASAAKGARPRPLEFCPPRCIRE